MSDKREERVRQRAHEIWLREGQPDGEGERHWALAEAEIDAESAPPKAVKKAPAAKPPKAAAPKAEPKKAAPAKAAPAKAAPAAKAAPVAKAPAKKPAKAK